MTADAFVHYLAGYARSFDAPVRRDTLVVRVERSAAGFAVHTDRGRWTARNVVIATGYHSRAKVPSLAAGLPADIAQLSTSGYRSPASLPGGGVLVVGASASGVQIAHELARAGRPVYLAVGCHTRLPRRYRGRDILWWLERIGSLDRTIDQMADVEAARAEPSLQLVGSAGLADSTPGLAAGPPDPPPPIAVPATPSRVDLRRSGIASVLWATGYRPWYPWLAVPVLDGNGRIRHDRGVTDVPGLFAIGLRFQYRRTSTFVDGARHDAAYLAAHVA